jgi:AcrR family transcriptional regulator
MNSSFIHQSLIELPRNKLANQQIREEQRTNILNAAREVFAQKGSSTTMDDIAERAGVSQGLAYRYFSSKEEIFFILFRETMESTKEYDQVIKELPGSSSERLERIVTRLMEMRKEKPGYYQLLYHMLSDEETPKEIRDSVTKRGIVFRREMRKLLIEGQKAGKIADDDPDQLLEAVMGAIDGLWRRIAYDPQSAKNLPDPKIILRMLKAD